MNAAINGDSIGWGIFWGAIAGGFMGAGAGLGAAIMFASVGGFFGGLAISAATGFIGGFGGDALTHYFSHGTWDIDRALKQGYKWAAINTVSALRAEYLVVLQMFRA